MRSTYKVYSPCKQNQRRSTEFHLKTLLFVTFRADLGKKIQVQFFDFSGEI